MVVLQGHPPNPDDIHPVLDLLPYLGLLSAGEHCVLRMPIKLASPWLLEIVLPFGGSSALPLPRTLPMKLLCLSELVVANGIEIEGSIRTAYFSTVVILTKAASLCTVTADFRSKFLALLEIGEFFSWAVKQLC